MGHDPALLSCFSLIGIDAVPPRESAGGLRRQRRPRWGRGLQHICPGLAGQLATSPCCSVQSRVVEFAENLDGKRAGRFKEHLEDARPVAPDKRISAPCIHAIFPLPSSVRGESPTWARRRAPEASPGYDKMPGARQV